MTTKYKEAFSITDPFEGNPPLTGGTGAFPSPMTGNKYSKYNLPIFSHDWKYIM